MQRVLAELEGPTPQVQAIVQTSSLDSMLQFILRNRMLETYVDSLSRDKATRGILSDIPLSDTATTTTITSTPDIIVTHDVLIRLSLSKTSHHLTLRDHARRFLRTEGVRIFTHRERHLLELYGYAVWQDQMGEVPHDTIECK